MPDGVVAELRAHAQATLAGAGTVAFLEGFLLFAPPGEDGHVLRAVHDAIDMHLFLPAVYGVVKGRREGRGGYVTVGPAMEPVVGGGNGNVNVHAGAGVDLEGEDDRPPQNFWVDPPGYVDDVVWPRYVRDHAWLLVAEEGEREGNWTEAEEEADLVRRVGDGSRVRTDVGVEVAPGCGSAAMEVVLRWAVDLILQYHANRR